MTPQELRQRWSNMTGQKIADTDDLWYSDYCRALEKRYCEALQKLNELNKLLDDVK
jgi:hypothetical protein